MSPGYLTYQTFYIQYMPFLSLALVLCWSKRPQCKWQIQNIVYHIVVTSYNSLNVKSIALNFIIDF